MPSSESERVYCQTSNPHFISSGSPQKDSPSCSPASSDHSSSSPPPSSTLSDSSERSMERHGDSLSDSEASSLSPAPTPWLPQPQDENDLEPYVMSTDLIRHWLLVKDYNWRDCPNLPEPNRPRLVMRNLVADFVSRYPGRLEQLIARLQISRATAAPHFAKVLDTLIADQQINWGRVVAIFAFAGELAVHCVRNGMHDIVPSIPQWTGYFILSRLKPWILKNGGWEGMIRFYEGESSHWSTYRTFGGIACACGVVGLVALTLKIGRVAIL